MPAPPLEQVYSYAATSAASLSDDGVGLRLATSGGTGACPLLFVGDLPAPAVQATALLVVGGCARSRFFVHGPIPTDPVVTCHADRLRFEALSACASVYARHDTDLTGDGAVIRPGVTNVDFNAPTREVLARVAARGTLRLEVGPEHVGLSSGRGESVERKVALPVRWVKGFAEAAVAQRPMVRAFDLPGPLAHRFLRAAPNRGRGLYVETSGREPRWSNVASPGAVAVDDPERLRLLHPLARHATHLTVYSAQSGVSCWQLDSPAGRTHLVLSPAAARGFSGEGGTLTSLAAEQLGSLVDDLELELAWQPVLDPVALAARTGHSVEQVSAAIDLLAARGRAGYDAAEGAYFHRDLPFDLTRVESLHPRLLAARKLVAADGVTLAPDGGEAIVRTASSEHRVRLNQDPPGCTCLWWGRHQGERGPCKHVLAAQLVRDRVRV